MSNISEKDKSNIIAWNDTSTTYSNNVCIHKILEKTAKIFPDKKAITFQSNSISYKELNNFSNILAKELIENNVSIEDFVILHLERRLELIISIYAILKAGGIYVPVSKEFPNERLTSIIEDTKPKIIITSKELSKNLNSNIKTILIDDFIEQNKNIEINNLDIDVKSTNLAYSIFTSGTTGKPKGVLIEHHSVLNRIEWMQKAYPINSNDVLIQKTPITFDVSIWELFWWSFVGAELVLLEVDGEKNPEQIISCIEKHNVSVIHFVPSMFSIFIQYLETVIPHNRINTLKWLFCSGEELYQNQVLNFYKINSQLNNTTKIINLYGPTEATVDVTYHTCTTTEKEIIPIGKPIDNTQIYIIDENKQILPPNTEGEIILCGVNLARGYHNRAELTSEKFIEINIFGETLRAYKTGDVGYYNNEGEIIYKGRIDTQIKLRGFRIELGEIENVIMSLPEINTCICAVQHAKTDNAYIVAFVVSKNTTIDTAIIKSTIKHKLPEYMIPTQIIQVESIPTSLSGKADRNTLLEKFDNQVIVENKDIRTKSSIEKDLIKIWEALLNNNNIDTNKNFFDLGGNSILLMQLFIKLKKQFEIQLDITDFMENPTIKLLSKFISQKITIN